MGEGVSTSVATSVIDARQELGECSLSHCASKCLRHRFTTHAGPRNAKHRRLLDHEDEDWYRGGRVPGPGPDVDTETHYDCDQNQEAELRDRKREHELDGGRDVGDEEAPVTKQSRTVSPSGQTVMKTANAVAGSPTKQQRTLMARGPPATATKPVRASPRTLSAADARRMGVELGAMVSQASGTPAASLRSSRRVKEEPAPMMRSRSGTQTQHTSRPTPSKTPSRKLSRPGSPRTLPSLGKTIPTAIPSGGSSSRLPTLIPGKQALAGKSLSTASAPTVQNQGLPSVAEGAPMILNRGTPTLVEEEKGKEDAWLSGADAMAAVEPGTKPGSRPSIQRVRRRRSSFSSMDINV